MLNCNELKLELNESNLSVSLIDNIVQVPDNLQHCYIDCPVDHSITPVVDVNICGGIPADRLFRDSFSRNAHCAVGASIVEELHSETLSEEWNEVCFSFIEGNITCAIDVEAFCSSSASDYNIDSALHNDARLEINRIIRNCYLEYPKESSTEPYEMSIKLTSEQPVYSHPRRLSYKDKFEVQKIVQELLDKGVIRHSDSPYASPIVLVKRKVVKLVCVLTTGI